MNRIDYTNADLEDYLDYISTRNNILYKLNATELWIKVIQKAVDDLVYFDRLRKKGKILTKEQLEYEQSANDFLFDPNYTFPFDDYIVNITCSVCKKEFTIPMSLFSSNVEMCRDCSGGCTQDNAEFEITNVPKEITLNDLLSFWGIEDIDNFRKLKYKQIEKLKSKNNV